jgi:hypothetical protein
MGDLAGRGPIGLKTGKAPKKPRKPIPKRSRKREAYMRSAARVEGLAHMERVAQEGCIVCGARPVEVHHEGKPRSDMNVLPLCPPHHRREFGPGAYHYSPKAFYALHGSSEELLARVDRLLGK